MATSDIDSKDKGLEISVELLHLLREINKKLDSKTGFDRGEIAPPGGANPPPQTEEIFRWYENTLPNKQIAGDYRWN